MLLRSRYFVYTAVLQAIFACGLLAQEPEDVGWRISPEKINVQVGNDRQLQLLDDSAQELHDGVWSVDKPELAEIYFDKGRVFLRPKAEGVVRVSATRAGGIRYREIRIWPDTGPLPLGTTKWGLHPIGREIGDLPLVPTAAGPEVVSLEQTPAGITYLRADDHNGIQLWTWRMPESTTEVELICGDWLGGAEIAANRGSSYTLYAVGNDGNLRWQHTEQGTRKGLAISTDHIVYLLTQSSDGASAHLLALDEPSGLQRFDLPLPASVETDVGVRHAGPGFSCVPGPTVVPINLIVSRAMVNMDGFAYLAFTHETRTLRASCAAGSTAGPGRVFATRKQELVLWQIHQDGTYRSTVVETIRERRRLSVMLSTVVPTGAVVTDNMNGTLISAKWFAEGSVDEYVYRVDPDGNVLYKFLLPQYQGSLQDEMVLGGDELGFATRGKLLIAFNVTTGKELWRWESKEGEISVFAALANGGCMVQTPTALVEVDGPNRAKEYAKGKFIMSWQGRVYRKH